MVIRASCRGIAFVLIPRCLRVLISAQDSIADAMRGGGIMVMVMFMVMVGVHGSCTERLHEFTI